MDNLNEQQKTDLQGRLADRERALREDIRREINLQEDYVQLASEVPDPGDLSFANLSIDLGNAAVTQANDPDLISALESRRTHTSELVREHVTWALGQHGAP